MAKRTTPGRRGARSTSFGKRSDAERDFKKRPRRSSAAGENRTFGKRSDERASSRFGSGARAGRDEATGGSSFSREEKPFRGRAGGPKRSARSHESSEDKPFRSRASDAPRRTSPRKTFAKPFRAKPYGKPEEGEGPRDKSSRAYGKPYKPRPYKSRKEEGADERKTSRPSFVQARVARQNKAVAATPEVAKADDGLIRLNKFIANSGICSRREADERIKLGLVSVNGTTITEMGFKVKPTDEVRYEGKKLKAERPVYILLNKPKGFITTTDDPQERNTVMSLVASAVKERIYPVGRLDRNTTGLLLLTNDGDLADKLTHPSYNVKKIYKVELDKPLSKADFEKITGGVRLEEGVAQVDDMAIVSDDGKTIGIEIHIGWNRIVRRLFEAFGYEVQKLDRVVYAGLDKKDLGRGQWRFLKPEEVVRLKHFG